METTLIIGTGVCAERVVTELAAAGDTRLLIVTDADSFPVEIGSGRGSSSLVEVLTNTHIRACRQENEHFRIDLTNGGKTLSRSVANIVVAEPEQREANYALNHLRPANHVVPLSRMAGQADGVFQEIKNPNGTTTIVFLTGLFAESNPVIAAEVMNTALHLQTDTPQNKKAVQTYVLTKNLKVAGDGLEALYRESKQAGTVYIKFTDTIPDVRQIDNAVVIAFTDEITGLPFTLTPTITVVDETILPSGKIANGMAAALCLEMDAGGFVQADNVHRQTVRTNRHRILVIGPSRKILGSDDQLGDAINAALDITAKGIPDPHQFENKATIDTGACVRCLTCHRLCPYRAIFLDAYPTVIPQDCERCGICAAECPQHAITIPGLNQKEIAARIESPAKILSGKTFSNIVAFCCSRSASQAANQASLMGINLPPGLKLVEVPCAGGLSVEHIFSGFRLGADGVLVLTCHEGNCHSSQGNNHAKKRVLHFKDRLATIGYETDRVEINTLASNMGTEFAELTHRFANKINALGPNR